MPLLLLPFIVLALPESWEMEASLGPTRSEFFQWLALLVAVGGLLVRCVAVAFAPDGTSSRDTRALRAPSLNTTGAYSVVRHPLYLGAGLMWFGVAMSTRVWWLAVIVGLGYWLYIERVALAEEAFLLEQFPEQFPRWAACTPAFIPQWSAWHESVNRFQPKRLLSEHNGLLAVALSFALLEFLEDERHGLEPLRVWYGDHFGLVRLVVFAVLVSAIAIVLRRSRWLSNDGEQTAPLPTIAET
jgi:protein-S-isoprenylcysteine O-methyltransferase Ste14